MARSLSCKLGLVTVHPEGMFVSESRVPAMIWKTVIDAIWRKLAEMGLTHDERAERTGVDNPPLVFLLSEQRTLWLDTADRLFQYLGLRVVEGPPERKRKTPRRPKGRSRRGNASREKKG